LRAGTSRYWKCFTKRKKVEEMSILNACVIMGRMVDEKMCKYCTMETCRNAGEPTTEERLEQEEKS
jgi:hypothetical protein